MNGMNLSEFLALIGGAFGGYFLAVCWYETFVLDQLRRRVAGEMRERFNEEKLCRGWK